MSQANAHREAEPRKGLWYYCWTGVLVLAAMAAYAVACAARLYCHTGRLVDLSSASVVRGLETTMGETMVAPLSVFSYPWMMPVLGLLWGVIILAPVAVAVRRGMWLGWVFALLAAVASQAVVLGLATAVGCVLAGRTRLRRRHPILAGWLGLGPAAVYLAVSAYSGVGLATIMPLQRWLLAVAPAVAILAAAGGMAMITAFRRVPGLRRASVLLAVVLLTASAMMIFSLGVGADELGFSLIARRVRSSESVFEPVSLETWKRMSGGQGLNPETLLASVNGWLAGRQRDLSRQCAAFLRDHPTSDRCPEVLWTLAQAQSLHVDEHALAAGVVRPQSDWPRADSRESWLALADGYPAAPQAALARWRLAQLAMRDAQIARADESLHTAAGHLRIVLAGQQADRSPARPALRGPRPSVPQQAYYAKVMARLERSIWLIEKNHLLTDPNAARAMADLAAVNPYQRRYRRAVSELVDAYSETTMAGNLKLALARATRDIYARAQLMVEVADNWREDGDAAIEANYELGRLILQQPVLRLAENIREPAHYFKLVTVAENPWRQFALSRLELLEPTTRPGP